MKVPPCQLPVSGLWRVPGSRRHGRRRIRGGGCGSSPAAPPASETFRRSTPSCPGACPPGSLRLVLRLTAPGGSPTRPRSCGLVGATALGSGHAPAAPPTRPVGEEAYHLRQRIPVAPCCCPCAASLALAASCTPARVCTSLSLMLAVPSCASVSAAAPPQRLQRCKRLCLRLLKQSPRVVCSSPPEQSHSAGCPSPAIRPVRALRRGPVAYRLPTELASRWRGACGLTPCWGRWKGPFDFPIPI